MWQIPIDCAKNWKEIANTNPKRYLPSNVDVLCPYPSCRRSLVQSNLSWTRAVDFAWTNVKCVACSQSSFLFLIPAPKMPDSETLRSSELYLFPTPPDDELLEDGIQEISPTFVEILRQVREAEARGLHHLVGMGYRKALEFLIKDYLVSARPDKSDEIAKQNLGHCIENHVNDPNLKQCARRAVWLGNDETHYQRRWSDKDVEDLERLLLKLTRHWISSEYLTKKYMEEMPSAK